MEFSVFALPCYRSGLAPTQHAFYEELIETVRLADRLGWERAWVSEHHFHYYGGAAPNPAMLLLAFARATERIRLGSGVSLLPLNDPLRVAEDFAMLDQLSGGRLEFGIGRGYLPHEFGGFEIAPEDATARFHEAFDIIAKAWSGEPFAYQGKQFSMPRLRLEPRPLQSPPPTWVACSRTRESFEWAGRMNFGLLMNQYPMSSAEMRTRFDWFKAAHARAGHDPARRRAMMALFLHVAETEEQAFAEAKVAVQEHANLFRLLIGGDQWSTEYVGDESVFKFIAPEGDVVSALRERTLVGTVDQICERIAAYEAQGFTEISFVVRYGALSHAQCLANITAVNERIRPRFQRRRAA